MRELVYFVAVSLDGRIAAPDGDFSAFPVTGDHLDMIVAHYRETLPAVALQAMELEVERPRFDAVLMGWSTYAAGFTHGIRDPYPHLDQHVFTRSGRQAAPGIAVSAEPLDTVRRLKAQPGRGIWLCGGGQLASALVDEIDRLVLKVNPLVLGDGIPLFAAGHDPRLFELCASTPFRSGVVVNEYARTR